MEEFTECRAPTLNFPPSRPRINDTGGELTREKRIQGSETRNAGLRPGDAVEMSR